LHHRCAENLLSVRIFVKSVQFVVEIKQSCFGCFIFFINTHYVLDPNWTFVNCNNFDLWGMDSKGKCYTISERDNTTWCVEFVQSPAQTHTTSDWINWSNKDIASRCDHKLKVVLNTNKSIFAATFSKCNITLSA
jgi:hypothetical protein